MPSDSEPAPADRTPSDLAMSAGLLVRAKELFGRFRDAGVVDGVWTAAASVGSKVQFLVVLGASGSAAGVEGAGLVVLAIATAVLGFALIDGGLTSQVARSYANGTLLRRSTLLRPLVMRSFMYPVVGAILFYLSVATHLDAGERLQWLASVIAYGAAFHWAFTTTVMAYARLRFRQAAVLNALVRIATIPFVLLASMAGLQGWTFIAILAIGEAVIAVLQYSLSRDASTQPETILSINELRLPRTWRYGTGAIANTLMNRSDTVILALVLSGTGLGTYALASSLENALVTVAMVPSGALIAHSARSVDQGSALAKARLTAKVVAALYVAVAVPFVLFTATFMRIALRVEIESALPYQIITAAGLFAVLGGVFMQTTVGMGRHRSVMRAWLTTLVISIPLLVVLSLVAGPLGAVTGALLRDALFFSVSYRAATASGAQRGISTA